MMSRPHREGAWSRRHPMLAYRIRRLARSTLDLVATVVLTTAAFVAVAMLVAMALGRRIVP